MKHIKSFNEEWDPKKIAVGAALVGGLGGVAGYFHDKSIEPTETVSQNPIPTRFKMRGKLLSIGTDMYLTNDNKENFGRIEERTLRLSSTFEYFDSSGKLKARAAEKILSLYTVIEITDENGAIIGYVEEEVIESMTSLFYHIFTIRDANKNILATSKKIDLFSSNVEISGSSGTIRMSQSIFTLGDDWDIEINSSIDKRLIVFIPSFIRSSQERKRKEKDN